MSRLLGKIGFIHRLLWSRSGLYCACLLLGPAPLLGAGLALAVWGLTSTVGAMTAAPPAPPQWAKPNHSSNLNEAGRVVTDIHPTVTLPTTTDDGTLEGYRAGWQVVTYGFRVSPTFAIGIESTPLASFFLDGPTMDLTRLSSGEPRKGLYAGVGTAMFVVKAPGRYQLSAKLERAAGMPANCLTRVVFGGRWLLSDIALNLVTETVKIYRGAWFELAPGLYPINFVFSCWHNQTTDGSGRMTLLVQHPEETALSPARSGDVVRRATVKP